jgi:hypothetical protein
MNKLLSVVGIVITVVYLIFIWIIVDDKVTFSKYDNEFPTILFEKIDGEIELMVYVFIMNAQGFVLKATISPDTKEVIYN